MEEQTKTGMMWPSQNFLLYFPTKIEVIQTNISFCAISCSRRQTRSSYQKNYGSHGKAAPPGELCAQNLYDCYFL